MCLQDSSLLFWMRVCSLPTAVLWPRTQPAICTPHFLDVCSLVPDHYKPGNVESISYRQKVFVGILDHIFIDLCLVALVGCHPLACPKFLLGLVVQM